MATCSPQCYCFLLWSAIFCGLPASFLLWVGISLYVLLCAFKWKQWSSVHHITQCVHLWFIFCVISRRNDEHDSRVVVSPLYCYLGRCLHHLYSIRGSVLCCIYWCHPVLLHLCQHGEKQRECIEVVIDRNEGETTTLRNLSKSIHGLFDNYCFSFLFQWVCVPFMFLSPAVTDLSQTPYVNQTSGNSWLGKMELADAGIWMDEFLLVVRFVFVRVRRLAYKRCRTSDLVCVQNKLSGLFELRRANFDDNRAVFFLFSFSERRLYWLKFLLSCVQQSVGGLAYQCLYQRILSASLLCSGSDHLLRCCWDSFHDGDSLSDHRSSGGLCRYTRTSTACTVQSYMFS